MKTLFNFFLLLAFSNLGAQTRSHQITEHLEDVNVIVLNLNGDTEISEAKTDSLIVLSELTVSGSVFGWTSDDTRPKFEIEIKKIADTLFVQIPQVWNQKVIGIDTYTEDINSIIYIPNNKPIVINKANNLKLNVTNSNIRVIEADKVFWDCFHDLSYKYLSCEARYGLNINGIDVDEKYETFGSGEGIILIKSKKIELK